MYTSLKDIREVTLQATYIKLDKFIKTKKNGEKEALKRIVDVKNRADWDAFDESIRLIIIDRAQLRDELQCLLFEDDPSVIKRAVKCNWFFQTAPLCFFLEELLPVVSVSTRLKVISSLAKARRPETESEQIFEWVRKQYGRRCAEPLLAACSESYIAELVLLKSRAFAPRTLIAITRRYPALGVRMADWWIVPKKAAVFLLQRKALLANWTGAQLHELNARMGRKLLRQWKPRLFELPDVHFDHLISHSGGNTNRFFRSLDDDARVKYLVQIITIYEDRITIELWKNSLQQFAELMKGLKPAKRENLLQQTFFEVYKKDLWDSKSALTKEVLQMISATRRAEMLTKHNLTDEDEFLYLSPPAEAIPKLIQKIKRTPESSERSAFVTQMISCCALAKDWASLDRVHHHVSSHHLNDIEVLDDWASNIERYIQPKIPVSQRAWGLILEIAGFLTSRNLRRIGVKLLMHHANYLVSEKKDVSTLLKRAFDIDRGACVNGTTPALNEFLNPIIKAALENDPAAPNSDTFRLLRLLLEVKYPAIDHLVKIYIKNAPEDTWSSFNALEVLPILLKRKEYQEVGKILISKLDFDNNFDLVWNTNPTLVAENLNIVLEKAVKRHPFVGNFLNDRRLWAFYHIVDPIKKSVDSLWISDNYTNNKNLLLLLIRCCNSSELMEKCQKLLDGSMYEAELKELVVRYSSGDLVTVLKQLNLPQVHPNCVSKFAVRSSIPSVRKFSATMIGTKDTCLMAVTALVIAESYEKIIEFLDENKQHVSAVPNVVLRFLWRNFLEFPSCTSCNLVESASQLVGGHLVGKIIKVQRAHSLFYPGLVNLVWSRAPEELKWKRRLISHWRGIYKYIGADVRLEMLNYCDAHNNPELFVYCWTVNPEDPDLRKVLEKYLKNQEFERTFTKFLISSDYSVIPLAFDDDVSQLLSPGSLYRLKLFYLLRSSPENFPRSFADFFHNVDEVQLVWPLIADALSHVLYVIPKLKFLFDFHKLSQGREGSVLCAYLLQDDENLPAPYTIDPDIELYGELLNRLQLVNDPVVNVYLAFNFSDKVRSESVCSDYE